MLQLTERADPVAGAGEVLVSATEGFEFSDLGGGDHVGGGSHGSLVAGDSEVPLDEVLTVLQGGDVSDDRWTTDLVGQCQRLGRHD